VTNANANPAKGKPGPKPKVSPVLMVASDAPVGGVWYVMQPGNRGREEVYDNEKDAYNKAVIFAKTYKEIVTVTAPDGSKSKVNPLNVLR